jgi:16S rRNA (uracil1498-N3)-methyltransferase
MHLFYCPDISENEYTLSEEESRHCIKVLRLREGDRIFITDGVGALHETVIRVPDQDGCKVQVVGSKLTPKPAPELHIALAPPKSLERFEWFLEKTTEIGISDITPLICTRSERTLIKQSRMAKIMASAMKQSLRTFLPRLHDATSFIRFISANVKGQKFIAFLGTGEEPLLKNVCKPCLNAVILIGPEGDFTEEEVGLAVDSGFIPVSLGPARLRTETAGVAACHTFALVNMP